MVLLTGFLFGLILLIGYLIILECIKRKRLGKVLMKVKLDFISRLSIAVILIGTILIILAIIYKFNQFNSSNIYGLSDKLVFGAMEAVYLMILARFFIGIICSREIREKGITLTKTNINYSDIRRLNWLSENKIEITFAVKIFSRLPKEKWTVKDDQITQLKQLFQEKYYDAY